MVMINRPLTNDFRSLHPLPYYNVWKQVENSESSIGGCSYRHITGVRNQCRYANTICTCTYANCIDSMRTRHGRQNLQRR